MTLIWVWVDLASQHKTSEMITRLHVHCEQVMKLAEISGSSHLHVCMCWSVGVDTYLRWKGHLTHVMCRFCEAFLLRLIVLYMCVGHDMTATSEFECSLSLLLFSSILSYGSYDTVVGTPYLSSLEVLVEFLLGSTVCNAVVCPGNAQFKVLVRAPLCSLGARIEALLCSSRTLLLLPSCLWVSP